MSLDDRVAALGRIIAKAHQYRRMLDKRAAELEALRDHLNDWSNVLMAARETAAEGLRIADEAHDANTLWEANLTAREAALGRLAHPSNQPPATDPQENQ